MCKAQFFSSGSMGKEGVVAVGPDTNFEENFNFTTYPDGKEVQKKTLFKRVQEIVFCFLLLYALSTLFWNNINRSVPLFHL